MTLPPGFLDFSVRRLRSGDAEALSRFYSALSEQSCFFYEPYKDTSLAAMHAVVQRTLDGVDLGMAAFDADGNVFAHFFFGDIAQEAPHLGIGLLDAYHGLGMGAVLLSHLLSLGRHALQKKAIGLTVVKSNQRAIGLYTKFGFRITGEASFRAENDSHVMQLDFPAP